MRKQIVAGNWKMNNDYVDSEIFVAKLLKELKHSTTEVIIAPPFTSLLASSNSVKGSQVIVAAQNMHFAENGAYTGEVSAKMLKSVGVKTVILGHSERRAYFNETDALLAKKVDTALAHNMCAIFCFGEELEDRKSGNEEAIVEAQIKNALFHLPASAWEHIVLAYEPVWAIGLQNSREWHFLRANLLLLYRYTHNFLTGNGRTAGDTQKGRGKYYAKS